MKIKINDDYFYGIQTKHGKLVVSLRQEYEKCVVTVGSYGRFSEGDCWKMSFEDRDEAFIKFTEITKALEMEDWFE